MEVGPGVSRAVAATWEGDVKAVRFDEYGSVDVLDVREVPDPEPGPGQVLVRVRAAGINPGEAKIREGALHDRWPATFPSGQGSDFAGVVERLTPGVTNVAVGDRVIGWVDTRSSQAEYVVAEAANLVPKPSGLPWEVAGAIPVAGFTASAMVRATGIKPGDTAVVSGAAGGVGALAVQLARRAGATVIGVASPSNHPWLARHEVIGVEYGEGLAERIREAIGGGGPVDAFLDTYGGDYVELALNELKVSPERVDTIVRFDAVAKYGVKAEGNAAGASAATLAVLAGLVSDKELEIPLAQTYPLDDVRAAYTKLAKGHTRGKIVLIPLVAFEYRVQRRGELFRLPGAAVLAAGEAVVATGEGHRLGAEQCGHRSGGTAGDRLAGLRADADDDAGRRGAQRVEVVLVVQAGGHVLPEERVVARAVVRGRQAEGGRIGTGVVQVVLGNRARVAGDRDELGHRRAEPAAQVRVVDVHAGGEYRSAVWQYAEGGRLVRDERPDLVRVLGDKRQRVDRPAAARENVHRPGTERRDQPVQVVGVLVGGGLKRAVCPSAAPGAPRVIGHHGAVGEVPGQRREPGGAHRGPDDQQDRVRARIGAPDVIVQNATRHWQFVGLRISHGRSLPLCGYPF
jgi:NADPH:quinone reductase-like Zn-dependent oxidoreductase